MLAPSIKYQQGSYLIESMISMLLVSILGLGVAYATSKSLAAQRYTTTQNITVMHMREYLQTRDSAKQTMSIAEQSITLSETPVNQELTVSIAGINSSAKTLPQVQTGLSLKASSTNLYGGDGDIILSHGAPAQSP